MSKVIQKKYRIISNIHLIGEYYKITFEAPEVARIVNPGQFLMLRISETFQPFLRRPFSIHNVIFNSDRDRNQTRIKKDCIEVLYRVVGKGTEVLSRKQTGNRLDVLGPLGNGFTVINKKETILVGGGIGIAPLLLLAEKVKRQNPSGVIQVLIGGKTKSDILPYREFIKMGCLVNISTDDGTLGFKGKVTDLLSLVLNAKKGCCDRTIIYACGPKPMLKNIVFITQKYNIAAQVSLDEYMACGLGVCLGCVVHTEKGQVCVCKSGPVFDTADIILRDI